MITFMHFTWRIMMRKHALVVGTVMGCVGLVGLGGLVACDGMQTRTEGSNPHASISIETSGRNILVGETVTFIARTRDTYGRSASVNWSSTAGDLVPDQNGRIARVTFRETGTYTVKATLNIDGQDVQSALAEVRVRPVN